MLSIIAGNWKMNGSKKDLELWFKDFSEAVSGDITLSSVEKDVKILICVPSIFIQYAQDLAKAFNSNNRRFKILIGSEDCHYKNEGAFTGNISPVFLKELGCGYTIVGHSERRMYEGETDDIVNKKAINALASDLIPIVCVGESLEIRENNTYLDFIRNQVLASLKDVDLTKAIIAYEPVWAIGTGKVPTTKEIEQINKFIKDLTYKEFKTKDVKVLYGGSVKSSNISDISKLKSVDGVLVGGASLKGTEFFNIFKNSL